MQDGKEVVSIHDPKNYGKSFDKQNKLSFANSNGFFPKKEYLSVSIFDKSADFRKKVKRRKKHKRINSYDINRNGVLLNSEKNITNFTECSSKKLSCLNSFKNVPNEYAFGYI